MRVINEERAEIATKAFKSVPDYFVTLGHQRGVDLIEVRPCSSAVSRERLTYLNAHLPTRMGQESHDSRRATSGVDRPIPMTANCATPVSGSSIARMRSSSRPPDCRDVSAKVLTTSARARRGLETLFLARLLENTIERILEAPGDAWKRRLTRQLERPVLSRRRRDRHVLQDGQRFGALWIDCRRVAGRRLRQARCCEIPVRTLIDPGFDGGDLLRGERAVHRHGRLLEVGDPAIQSALIGLPRNNRGAVVQPAAHLEYRRHDDGRPADSRPIRRTLRLLLDCVTYLDCHPTWRAVAHHESTGRVQEYKLAIRPSVQSAELVSDLSDNSAIPQTRVTTVLPTATGSRLDELWQHCGFAPGLVERSRRFLVELFGPGSNRTGNHELSSREFFRELLEAIESVLHPRGFIPADARLGGTALPCSRAVGREQRCNSHTREENSHTRLDRAISVVLHLRILRARVFDHRGGCV